MCTVLDVFTPLLCLPWSWRITSSPVASTHYDLDCAAGQGLRQEPEPPEDRTKKEHCHCHLFISQKSLSQPPYLSSAPVWSPRGCKGRFLGGSWVLKWKVIHRGCEEFIPEQDVHFHILLLSEKGFDNTGSDGFELILKNFFFTWNVFFLIFKREVITISKV